MPVIRDNSGGLKARFHRGNADPSRLSIAKVLRGGEKPATGLAGATGLSHPNASAHLAGLMGCGPVASRRLAAARCLPDSGIVGDSARLPRQPTGDRRGGRP